MAAGQNGSSDPFLAKMAWPSSGFACHIDRPGRLRRRGGTHKSWFGNRLQHVSRELPFGIMFAILLRIYVVTDNATNGQNRTGRKLHGCKDARI